MVKGRKGRKEGRESSIRGCSINRLGGRDPDHSTYGLGRLFCSPRGTGALLGETGGTGGPSHPRGAGEAEVSGGTTVGFRGASLVPFTPEPTGHSLSPMPGFSWLLYQPPISGLRRIPGGGPGECPA